MKILIIQENGRHEANRDFRECFCMQRALTRLGHGVDVWGLGHDNFQTFPIWQSYDIILNFENYDATGWVPTLECIRGPKKILWSIDAHFRGMEPYLETFSKGNYDLILQSTKDFVGAHEASVWFPNCYDNTLIKPSGAEKKWDFGFCGNYVNRKPILEWLQNEYELHLDIFVIGEEMVKAVNSYRCHFNLNMDWKRYNRDSGVNYRTYETIGCGTLLLTSHSSEYEELGFKDGINCFIYDSIDELKDKIAYIKNNDTSAVAKNGLELSQTHTYNARAKTLLSIVEGLER